jgi:hypothetical protein
MTPTRLLLAAAAMLAGSAAGASTPPAWASMNRAVNRACLSMVDLKQKKIVGDTASFPDTVPVELRIVEGYNRGNVIDVKLCAYDRRTKRAAISEAEGRLGVNRR